MDETTLLKRKILDNAKRAYRQNIYTYTDFLSLNEFDVYTQMSEELSFIRSKPFGGGPDCERRLIRFGSVEAFGYEEDLPIDLLCIAPRAEKFAEPLTHRDYLGALMNLGIARGLLGDLCIDGPAAYLYCMNHITDFIIENLKTIRHTAVHCKRIAKKPAAAGPRLSSLHVVAASARLDAVVSALTNRSRSSVLALFNGRKVFVNGRCIENHSTLLKPEDILVIRGTGKYVYEGIGGMTRKGRVSIQLKKYE